MNKKFLFYKLPFFLLAFLVVVIPFQAFLITWARSFFSLDDFGFTLISLWKEFLIFILLVVFSAKTISEKKLPFKIIFLDKIIFVFFALCFIYLFFFENSFTAKIAGLRYDTVFLALYFLARGFISKKDDFIKILKYFLYVSVPVVLFGLIQIFANPSILEFFGYSSGLGEYAKTGIIPTYTILNPSLPGIYRVQSFLPGALQLSSYLLLLFFVLMSLSFYKKEKRIYFYVYMFFSLIALVFTFTRSAWIGFILASFFIVYILIKKKYYLFVPIFLIGTLGYISFKKFSENLKFQAIFLHGMFRDSELFGSTLEHLEAKTSGFSLILSNPLGWGLGTFGPASKFSESPFIPESFYLQIGGELGVLGLFLFLAIIISLGVHLFEIYKKSKDNFYKFTALGLLGALIALSVSSLFLHTFTDTATVYPFWIFVGILISAFQNSAIINKAKKENK